MKSRTPPLVIAARTASTSYRDLLPVQALVDSLVTGVTNEHWMPHVRALLEEAPVSLLGQVVEQINTESNVSRERVWANMRSMALRLKVARSFWVTMDPAKMGPDGAPGQSWFQLNSF